jgi:hypothetical protein
MLLLGDKQHFVGVDIFCRSWHGKEMTWMTSKERELLCKDSDAPNFLVLSMIFQGF